MERRADTIIKRYGFVAAWRLLHIEGGSDISNFSSYSTGAATSFVVTEDGLSGWVDDESGLKDNDHNFEVIRQNDMLYTIVFRQYYQSMMYN